MLAICTYCSAGKHNSETPLPAIDLYKSSRITKVFETAEKSNVTFLILSGKYGLIRANEEIGYYDHLLIPSEVESILIFLPHKLRPREFLKSNFT